MDGWITIGTELTTDKFDRQILNLEKKIKKEEDKKVVIGTKLGGQEQELENQRRKVDELAESYQRLKGLQDVIQQGKATPEQFGAFQGLTNQFGSLEQLANTFDKALTSQDLLEQKVNSTKIKYDEINANITEMKAKIEGINLQKHQTDVNRIRDGFKSIGTSIQAAIKKAGRLAISIFAVRSAYLTLRRASSDLATYDSQYAANLEYIRYALTQMIAPVLRAIVQMASVLLRIINIIVNALFGINLFANGSAESFKKMKASAGGVSKSVKEIKKQLAGFDEINMLTEQSDTGTSGGAGGVTMPEFDLSEIEGETPEWMKWIAENKDLLIGALVGIATSLILLKLGIGGLLNLGLSMIIGGIVALILDIIKFIQDPSWTNFANILRDLAIVLAGVAIAMLAVNSASPVGWLLLAVAVVTALVAAIIQNWDKIKEIFSKAAQWFYDKVIKPTGDFFVNMWDGLKNGAAEAWEGIKSVFSKVGQFFSDTFRNAWTKVKEVFSVGGKIFDGIKEGIVNAFKTIVNAIINGINKVVAVPFNAINNVLTRVKNIDILGLKPFGFVHTINVPQIPRLRAGGIINMPNRGTLIGGTAIAGEAGKEGVIPLTDQQAMSELGREIGRNVVVNLTNVTPMNSRVIGRELKQIQGEQEFAFNS